MRIIIELGTEKLGSRMDTFVIRLSEISIGGRSRLEWLGVLRLHNSFLFVGRPTLGARPIVLNCPPKLTPLFQVEPDRE
jgi:hypothetical protein